MIMRKEKQAFIVWLLENYSFKHQESIWFFEFIIRQHNILKNLKFVENAHLTPRGLQLVTNQQKSEFSLSINGLIFTDFEQIFHEIRFNEKKILYFECGLENAWQNHLYLSVLENNPYAPWNDQISEQLLAELNLFWEQYEKENKIILLNQQINQSLQQANAEAFYRLTNKLNQLINHD